MLPIKIMSLGGGGFPVSINLLGSLVDTNTGNKILAVTPAVGQLLIVFATFSGTVLNGVTDDQGGTYTQINAVGAFAFFVRTALVSSAVLHTITSAQLAASTGGSIFAFTATGMTKTGATAVLASNGSTAYGAVTPTCNLGTVSLNSPVLCSAYTTSNPCGEVAPAGYAEDANTGYLTPTTGMQLIHINGGQAVATVTWGAVSATGGNTTGILLDVT